MTVIGTSTVTAASFANTGLTDDEAQMLAKMIGVIAARSARNARLDRYFEGTERLRNLGIAIPPEMSQIESVVGWPTMAVDILEERLNVLKLGVPGGDDFGLNELWLDNKMQLNTVLAHTDALIYGLEFIAASIGDTSAGEPDVLYTIESPKRMTGLWDPRTGRLRAAASVRWDPEKQMLVAATLYLPDETIFLTNERKRWELLDIHEHRLGRVPVVCIAHRPRSGRPYGTSRISRAIISYTDNAVRTMMGMEVAREFFAAPQRYALGVDKNSFVDKDGQPVTAWEAYLGRVWGLKVDPDSSHQPSVGQFPSNSPAPFVDQVEALASMAAAEMNAPISYMGFNTDNAPSGDSTRSHEARLNKRGERCQEVFGAGYVELNQIAIALRDGSVPPPVKRLSVIWRDVATPTKSATADQVTKYVGAGVLLPDSEVTFEMMGLDDVTIRRLVDDHRRARVRDIARALTGAPPAEALSAAASN